MYVAYDNKPADPKTLLQSCLDYDYTTLAPIGKAFLKQERTGMVMGEAAWLNGHRVFFLVTQTTYDSGEGSMTRIYYHALYTGEKGAIRLTTAGGHRAKGEDTGSYRYATEFDTAIRKLFERFIFPES